MRWQLSVLVLTGCGFLTEDDLEARMDQDGDGYMAVQFGGTDCDDGNRDIWPGAVEVCDGIDNNCNGEADDDALDKRTWYRDADADGYGSPSTEEPAVSCFPPEGFVGDASDCNDDPNQNGANIHPRTIWYKDKDGDGYGDPNDPVVTCFQLPGLVDDDQDCDDTDPELNPETLWWEDRDGDGFGTTDAETLACWVEEEIPELYIRAGSTSADCDDEDPAIFPGSAVLEDNLELCAIDQDLDGFGDDSPTNPSHQAGTDCNDDDNTVFPGARELWYDQRLNDCSGEMNTVSVDTSDEVYSGASPGDQLGKAVRGIGYFFSCDPAHPDCEYEGQTPDIAIAAPSEASHGPSSGAVYLANTELDSERATVLGSAAINRLGRHITAAGDLNDDGFHDIVVGTQDDYAFVLYGGNSRDTEVTLSTHHKSTALAVYTPYEEGEELGAASAGLHGFCRTEEQALVLGAPMSSSIGDASGRVYIVADGDETGTVNLFLVYQGYILDTSEGAEGTDWGESDDGTDTDGSEATFPEIWTVEPEEDGSGARLGETLARIGDFTGDGIDELAIGAPNADWSETNAGAVYLLAHDDFPAMDEDGLIEEADTSGFTKEIYATSLIRLDGKFDSDHLGRSLSTAGDFNNDGRMDLAMAASGSASTPRPGRVYIWFGEAKTPREPTDPRTFGIEGVADLIIEPDDTLGAGNLGSALANAGDIDRDGMSDLLIGSPDVDTPAYAAGRVYLIYGGATGTWAIEDLVDLKDLGDSSESADAGDRSSHQGALFFGDAAFNLGTAIDGVGDVNGDGTPDLLLGAPGADLYDLGTGTGAAFLFYGKGD